MRAKANATIRQRDEREPPRKKKLSFFAPQSPVLRKASNNCNNDLKAHKRNLMILQEEEEKLNPNKEVVMDLMKKTFFIRRQNILKAPASVPNLLKIYPSLRNCDQVSDLVMYIIKSSYYIIIL